MTISKAIDPARVGLSKSLMTNPCERKGYFAETVRDENGRRLSWPLPERVTFGSAVDEAVSYIVWHDREGQPWRIEDGIKTGMDRARSASGWPLVPDEHVFELQVANAVALYCTQDDGLPRIRSHYPDHLRIQGDDGR